MGKQENFPFLFTKATAQMFLYLTDLIF